MPPGETPAAQADPASAPAPDARFERLLRDYGRLISAVVARFGGPAVALVREDVEQEVRLSLWRQVRAEQEIHHPSSYVFAAAVRETVRFVRRELARRSRQGAAPDGEPAEPAGRADPLAGLEARERGETLEACLRTLIPERERAVRAHLAGFDVQEIMRMYNWPYHKARNLIARGMADLRCALAERGLHG